jgi:integrase
MLYVCPVGQARLVFVPNDKHHLLKFGDGDIGRAKKFLLSLATFLEGKPYHTKRTYRAGIQQFFDMFDWISPSQVTAAHGIAFKKRLLKSGKSEATTYYRLCALTSFFDYLCLANDTSGESLLKSNPFRVVGRSDIKPTPYSKAEAVEWEKLKEIIDSLPTSPVGLRDKAILLTLAFTGRRRAEVAKLRVKDLRTKATPKTYTVKVKGGREMQFELPEIVWEAIKAYWIAADRMRTMTPESGVFTGTPTPLHPTTEEPISDRTVNEVLLRAIRGAGIDKGNMRVHGIRHMVARDLDRGGVRLQDIQAFLGHVSPNTTQIYLGRISKVTSAHEDVLTKLRGVAKRVGADAAT